MPKRLRQVYKNKVTVSVTNLQQILTVQKELQI